MKSREQERLKNIFILNAIVKKNGEYLLINKFISNS